MSGAMDDLYVGASSGEGVRGGDGRGLTERINAPKVLGRPKGVVDTRLFRHDVRGAQLKPAKWHVTKDDRIEATDAGELLDRIHRQYGIDKEEPGVIEAFNDGLFFYHTLNSASVMQPARGRVEITMGNGHTTTFDMAEVVRTLGVDMRRFFRTYADSVRQVNQKVLDDCDVGDIESVERREWLLEVAYERNLERFPDLAHDSASACFGLSAPERSALAKSKLVVLPNTHNAADNTSYNTRFIAATDASGDGAKRN